MRLTGLCAVIKGDLRDVGGMAGPWLAQDAAVSPEYLYIAAVRWTVLSCRRPDDCEMPLLLLATPYGVDAAIGASATGFRRTPRALRDCVERLCYVLPCGWVRCNSRHGRGLAATGPDRS